MYSFHRPILFANDEIRERWRLISIHVLKIVVPPSGNKTQATVKLFCVLCALFVERGFYCIMAAPRSPAHSCFSLQSPQGLLAIFRLIIYTIISAVTVLGNALTLWAVATTDRLRTKTYTLPTSLAVSDFLSGFILIDYVVHEAASSDGPCDLAVYKSAVRPVRRHSNGTLHFIC